MSKLDVLATDTLYCQLDVSNECRSIRFHADHHSQVHVFSKLMYWCQLQVSEMREKNLDLMRQDIVSVLKNSSMAFVRELVGADPVAVFRWAILRAFFRAYFAFNEAGIQHRQCKGKLAS